jgi:hypothetical protein
VVDALLIGSIAAEGICLSWCYRPDETAVAQPTGVMGELKGYSVRRKLLKLLTKLPHCRSRTKSAEHLFCLTDYGRNRASRHECDCGFPLRWIFFTSRHESSRSK